MAKIETQISLTLRLFKNSNYEFIRPSLGISDIDTSKPDEEVKKDIQRAIKVSRYAYDALTEEMNKLIKEQQEVLEKELAGK